MQLQLVLGLYNQKERMNKNLETKKQQKKKLISYFLQET